MPKRDNTAIARYVLETPDSTVLDVIDELLNKGVMANGDVMLGVAGVDLIYLRLSSVLCAADNILPRGTRPRKPKRRRVGGRR